MIQEHDALLLQGTLVAQDLRINPEVAPKGRYLLSAHVAVIGELREKTGLGFDTAYLEHSIMAHQTVIRNLDRAAQADQPLEVRRFLDQARPILQMHLNTARELQRAILSGR